VGAHARGRPERCVARSATSHTATDEGAHLSTRTVPTPRTVIEPGSFPALTTTGVNVRVEGLTDEDITTMPMGGAITADTQDGDATDTADGDAGDADGTDAGDGDAKDSTDGDATDGDGADADGTDA
jgi:hypothetical protein